MVISEEVIVGKLLPTAVTVMVKLCVSTAPAASAAVSTTEWVPTSLLVGVPDSTPVAGLNVSQDGLVAAARVTVSPLSTSEASKV